MEIYQVSKYENIADRLKRLSNNPVSAPNNPSDSQSSQGYRKYLSPNHIRRDNSSHQIEFKPKIGTDYSKYLKISTLQSDRLSEQQSTTFISELNFCRENSSLQPTAKQQINNFGRRVEQNNFSKPEQSFQAFSINQKRQSFQGEKKTLNKIKSDNNLKIDEIMQSFNSYKQNKQKFLSTIGKSYVKNPQYNENQVQKTSRPKIQQKVQQKKRPFDEIENIWNGQSNILDNSPKFQRSGRNNTEKYQNLTDLINQITKREEPIQQKQQKNAAKFKSFIRSNTRPEQSTSYIQKPSAINTILSPRAVRAPGKICKNNDRTFAGSIKQSF